MSQEAPLFNRLSNKMAVGMSALALAAGVGAATEVSSADNQSSQTSVCEQDGLGSFSIANKGNTFSYIRRHGHSNRVIRWKLRYDAMDPSCNGVVTRSVRVQELIGTRPDKLIPNTKLQLANTGNGEVNKGFIQNTNHPFLPGEWIQGIVEVVVTPADHSQPAIEVHPTSIATAR